MADAIAEKAPEKVKDSIESDSAEVAAAELLKEFDEEEKAKPEEKGESEAPDKLEPEGEKSEAEAESGDGVSQPEATHKGKRGFKRRQARLVNQRNEAKAEADQASSSLSLEREKSKLLEMRIQQLESQPEPTTGPNPDTFDGGEIDPDYIQAKKSFDDQKMRELVSKQVAEVTQQSNQATTQQNRARDLERKQEKHWEEADAMGAKDYDESEEIVTKLLGPERVNGIIDYFPGDSHKVIFYLGRKANREEAEDLAELFESGEAGLAKAVAGIGGIIEKIKSNPQTPIVPDPDEETEGSAPSHQESLQLRLDKLREDAAKSGRKDGMKRILEFKRKTRDRGITLR